MNRHILGLTIFLVIVKTTFLLYWGFFAPQPFVHFTESEVYTETARSHQTNCFPKLDKPLSAPVDIATLDLKTGAFYMSLNSRKILDFDSEEPHRFSLAFYTKDPQPRRIGTEFISPKNYSAEQIEFTCFANWVAKNLKPNQTLYVVPYKFTSGKIPVTSFDEANAIPVLLITGKN